MKILFLFAMFCCSSIAVAGGKCKVTGEAAVGFLDLEINGCEIGGTLKKSGGKLSGTFTVDLNKLDTGLSLRNKHMKEIYLETKKYPKAKLVLKPIKNGDKTFNGSFTLHGKTKLVTGKVLHASNDKLEASFEVNIKDYNIQEPSFKGIIIGDVLTVFATVL